MLTATEVARAVRGAWKHTGATVSHDPKGWTTLPSQSPFTIYRGKIRNNLDKYEGGEGRSEGTYGDNCVFEVD
ncbi:hypothetical protein SO802_005009 [Lithocarpus litseifolius]|uniref:Uncharacterized protein n=1 Tax=Lithocarpus litseifolius TaxID=425828 RepID=A0AAW2DLI0_9ROSI